MDLRLRAFLHGNLQCPALLLRHVQPLQRRRSPVRFNAELLEILALLPHPLHLLDWRCHVRYITIHNRHLCPRRSRAVQPTAWPNLRAIRVRVRPTRGARVPHEPDCDE